MNFSQEIYLVIGVLRSCIYNLTINPHCAWVPWLNCLPSNKLKEDNSLFTSDNCQHRAIFLRIFHIVYESKRWAFVELESISLQIIKKNYHIRFCLKSDGCKVISIAHHHIRKAGDSNTKSKQKLWQRDTCLVELWIDWVDVTWNFSSEMNGWPWPGCFANEVTTGPGSPRFWTWTLTHKKTPYWWWYSARWSNIMNPQQLNHFQTTTLSGRKHGTCALDS